MCKALVILSAWLALTASTAYANISRTGNVIDDGGGGGGEYLGIIIGIVSAGACVGALYAKYQQSKGREYSIDGGAIQGGIIAFFTAPVWIFLLR